MLELNDLIKIMRKFESNIYYLNLLVDMSISPIFTIEDTLSFQRS